MQYLKQDVTQIKLHTTKLQPLTESIMA